MNYHRRVNRHFYVVKPTEVEMPERKRFKTKRTELKPWNFTGCKNEKWLKFIEERVTW